MSRVSAAQRAKSSMVAEREIMRFALPDAATGGKLGLKQTATCGLSSIAATVAGLLGYDKHPSWDAGVLTVA